MKTDDEIRQTIRNNLKNLRTINGKTQMDIARLTGKSENAVGSWEQGLSLPDIATLYRLALYYNKTIDYMYEKHSEGENI
jgi:transcriptional regulator with XRE-family HTH domain